LLYHSQHAFPLDITLRTYTSSCWNFYQTGDRLVMSSCQSLNSPTLLYEVTSRTPLVSVLFQFGTILCRNGVLLDHVLLCLSIFMWYSPDITQFKMRQNTITYCYGKEWVGSTQKITLKKDFSLSHLGGWVGVCVCVCVYMYLNVK
jgi:hypothetical protein